jgi:hypothetical protein
MDALRIEFILGLVLAAGHSYRDQIERNYVFRYSQYFSYRRDTLRVGINTGPDRA